jgi:hypothetical protein
LIGAGPVDGPSHLTTAEMLAPRAILLRRCGGGMSNPRKTRTKRLREAVERVRGSHAIRKLVRQPTTDWSDVRTREVRANAALILTDLPVDVPIRKAFQQFDLDPADPFSWRLLLMHLSAIFFEHEATRPRGAPPKWNEPERKLFEARVAEARRALKRDGLRPTNKRVAERVQSAYPSLDIASVMKYIASGLPKRKH